LAGGKSPEYQELDSWHEDCCVLEKKSRLIDDSNRIYSGGEMKQEHFEILLEEIKGYYQLLSEGFVGVNSRLDRADRRLDNLETGMEFLKTDVSILKTDVSVLKTDVRDIKRNMGLVNAIASDHEGRLQTVENKLDDHLDGHS
jgi:chromosome segregation ATPase